MHSEFKSFISRKHVSFFTNMSKNDYTKHYVNKCNCAETQNASSKTIK